MFFVVSNEQMFRSSKVKERCDRTAWETTSVLDFEEKWYGWQKHGNRYSMQYRNNLGTSMHVYYTFIKIILVFLSRIETSMKNWSIEQYGTSTHRFDLPSFSLTVLSQLPADGPQHSIVMFPTFGSKGVLPRTPYPIKER